MDRWCLITDEIVVSPGDFLEAKVVGLSGTNLILEPGLIHELAVLFMASYENQAPLSLIALADQTETPERTKHYYRRMFDEDGAPTQEFVTWASETFAAWLEECFEAVFVVDRNRPHLNDPVYDLLSIAVSGSGATSLRVVQVKATPANLANNCNDALTKFKRLEDGDFDAELLSRLTMMQLMGKLPIDSAPRELMYDVASRSYRVTALHEQDRDTLTIMTTYDKKVIGTRTRRSARLARIEQWHEFWGALADEVYALLT